MSSSTQSAIPTSPEGDSNSSAAESIRVLFVDDDPSFTAALRARLRSFRKKWKTEFFDSSKSLAESLVQGENVVIVSDRYMPGGDGLQLCRWVRDEQKNGRLGSAYFIMLSGAVGEDNISEGLETGADDYLTKPFGIRELVARIGVGLRLVETEQSLRLINDKLSEANDRLESLAHYDHLTGLWNRRRGHEFLESELARVKRRLYPLGICLIDIDHFKQINDTYGHDVGDRVLQDLSKHMLNTSREYDGVVRWGGEEFLIAVPGMHKSDFAGYLQRTHKLLTFESHPTAANQEGPIIPVQVSMGATLIPLGSDISLTQAIKQADEALYQAKEEGRNCYCVFEGES